MNTKELIAEISDLPLEERAKIIDNILQSLNATNTEIESAWVKVVEERLEEYEKGDVELIPADKVFKRLSEITKE